MKEDRWLVIYPDDEKGRHVIQFLKSPPSILTNMRKKSRLSPGMLEGHIADLQARVNLTIVDRR